MDAHAPEWRIESKVMIRVKSSQRIFTDKETATLTGIGLDRLHQLARKRHIGFIVHAPETAGARVDQWLFTLSDLMVLAKLYPRCQN